MKIGMQVPYSGGFKQSAAQAGARREISEICREIGRREGPVEHDGKFYKMPCPPERGPGLGKPLKIIPHLDRPDIPIYVASLGEKNVQMTAELANGWLPI